MNELQVFKNEQFGEVRTINEDGNVLFCGADVARSLGYDQPHKAIERHCKGGTVRNVPHPQSADKTIDMLFIPESDLYRLIVKSQLPAAEKFERWVFEEVLPTIRKTGAYMTPEKVQEVLLNPDTIITLATQIKELQAKVKQDAPKVLFAKAVEASDDSILIGELAKLIKQNGVSIGQNRLFQWMRENGYLMRDNMPTQYAMEREWFKVLERTINNPDGSVRITRTTKVTGKGQTYFVNRFLGDQKTA